MCELRLGRAYSSSFNHGSSKTYIIPLKGHFIKYHLHLLYYRSERIGKTGVSGTLLTEAKYINLSLHHLERVRTNISSLKLCSLGAHECNYDIGTNLIT